MTIFLNMLARRHDGVEALKVFFEWLELNLRRWLRCDGCSGIGTKDHNLGSIDRVEKAKKIGYVVTGGLFTVRQLGSHCVCKRDTYGEDILRYLLASVCARLLRTMPVRVARPGQGPGRPRAHRTT